MSLDTECSGRDSYTHVPFRAVGRSVTDVTPTISSLQRTNVPDAGNVRLGCFLAARCHAPRFSWNLPRVFQAAGLGGRGTLQRG